MTQFTSQTQEHFLEKARIIHGSTYDYSLTTYRGSREKVVIICRKHGEFMQTPSNHYKGNGCPICALRKIGRRTPQSIPSKYRGVSYVYARKKWKADIFINGKRVVLGKFNTEEDAHLAYAREWDKLYGNETVIDIDGETWKQMNMFDGQYYVSNKGRFKTMNYKGMGFSKLLITEINCHGYVDLRINGYNALAHRVVAEYFLGKSNLQVNHKDGNRQNNYVENLEYVSNRVNVCHGFVVINGRKYIGARIRKRDGRYTASIGIDGRNYWLGAFDTPEESCNQYLLALKEHGLIDEYNYIVQMLSKNG